LRILPGNITARYPGEGKSQGLKGTEGIPDQAFFNKTHRENLIDILDKQGFRNINQE